MYEQVPLPRMKQGGGMKDPLVSRIFLDMKALALLYQTDVDLRSVLRSGLLDSHDDQVGRVLIALRSGKPEKKSNSVVLALGELVLASFLMAAGVVAIAPFLVGMTDPTSLVAYFSSAVGGMVSAPAFLPVLPELVILLSLTLLLSALYALRRASVTLKEEGFVGR
jgi:hypothetical protein